MVAVPRAATVPKTLQIYQQIEWTAYTMIQFSSLLCAKGATILVTIKKLIACEDTVTLKSLLLCGIT